MNEPEAIAALSAMAHQTRLRMIKTLVAAGPKGMTAGALASAVGASPSRASFHLSKLAETGLVHAQRQAREIIYAIDFRAMGSLVRFILEECCSNDASVRACCGLSQDLPTGTGSGGR